MSDLNTEKNKRPAPVLELLATLYTLEQLETATHDMPQLALAGRSNVGKSSLINALARRRKLAKVSSEPGKTRSVNLFKVMPDGSCRDTAMPDEDTRKDATGRRSFRNILRRPEACVRWYCSSTAASPRRNQTA